MMQKKHTIVVVMLNWLSIHRVIHNMSMTAFNVPHAAIIHALIATTSILNPLTTKNGNATKVTGVIKMVKMQNHSPQIQNSKSLT